MHAPAVHAPTVPGPVQDVRPPKLKMPPGACDCHAHVFGPQTQFPYVTHAAYIAPDASPEDYVRMLRAIGCERGVLVQPSVYGTDNRAMLAALRSRIFAFRGVAVIDESIGDNELADMHAAGVRGVRINLASATPGLTLAQAPRLADRLKAFGWHLQFFMKLSELTHAEEKLGKLKVDLVIDHFAQIRGDDGIESPLFRTLLNILRRDNVWAKIMGPYFVSSRAPGYADVTPFARAVVAAAPDRVLWGTDWPHPATHGLKVPMPNDGDLADMLLEWVPDETQRRRILVDNPARLYGF